MVLRSFGRQGGYSRPLDSGPLQSQGDDAERLFNGRKIAAARYHLVEKPDGPLRAGKIVGWLGLKGHGPSPPARQAMPDQHAPVCATGLHQMDYAMPAIRRALTATVATPAVSRIESCQSCFGSNAMLHGWRQQSGDIDLDHGGCRRASDLPVHPGKCHQHPLTISIFRQQRLHPSR